MPQLQGITPKAVEVSFFVEGASTPLVISFAIANLNLREFTGVAGNSSTKRFHDTAAADAGITNIAELTALAKQIATDWYLYQLGPLDIKYANIIDWFHEGLSDCLEYTYRLDEVSTRVQRPVWNDMVEELSHLSSVIPPVVGGTTITVEYTDTSIVVPNVTTLEVAKPDGYVLSTPMAGVAVLNFAAATGTQQGAVSLATQVMGDGDKIFRGNISFQVAHKTLNWTPLETGGIRILTDFQNLNQNVLTLEISEQENLLGLQTTQFSVGHNPYGDAPDTGSGICILSTTYTTGRYAIHDGAGNSYGITLSSPSAVTTRGGIVIGSGTLGVASGGTGNTSLTANGILIGNGSSAIQVTAAGTTGQVLTATTGSAPTFQALPEVSGSVKGIVNLSDQVMGAGKKMFQNAVTCGNGAYVTIPGASNPVNLEVTGDAYFDADIVINRASKINTGNTGGVDLDGIYFNAPVGEIALEVPSVYSGGNQLIARVKSFSGGGFTQDAFDLSVMGGNPVFSINGTQSGVAASTAFANPKSMTVQGGIVMSCTAGDPGHAGTLFTATATATVGNTTTPTTLIGSGVGSTTLAANYLVAGKTIHIKAWGYYSATTVGGATMKWQIKFGSTVVLDTGAITPAAIFTNLYWELEADITCRTTGAGGTVFGQGRVLREEATGSTVLISPMTNTATTTIDTTVTEAVDLVFTWSAASASDTISCSNFSLESRN